MLNTNKTINISGTSYIKENDIEKNIAYMSATISQDGATSINKTINNKELFTQNKDEVIKDFNDFEKYVYDIASE